VQDTAFSTINFHWKASGKSNCIFLKILSQIIFGQWSSVIFCSLCHLESRIWIRIRVGGSIRILDLR